MLLDSQLIGVFNRLGEHSPKAPLNLLLEADPCEENVRGYLEQSAVYGVIEGGKTIGVCVILPQEDCAFELMNIAVVPDYQAQGVGSLLLQYAIDETKALGGKKLVLGTGTFGYQLIFYQRAGFRVSSVERDFFINNYPEPIFEFGIQHRDRLVLERLL